MVLYQTDLDVNRRSVINCRGPLSFLGVRLLIGCMVAGVFHRVLEACQSVFYRPKKVLDCVSHEKLQPTLKEVGMPQQLNLMCHLYCGPEATVVQRVKMFS